MAPFSKRFPAWLDTSFQGGSLLFDVGDALPPSRRLIIPIILRIVFRPPILIDDGAMLSLASKSMKILSKIYHES